MFAHLLHWETHPHIAALLRRIIAAVAAATGGLLAWTAIVPAASAAIIPIPVDGPYGPAAAPLVYIGGMPGWQIALIASASATVAATAAGPLACPWAGRRSASTPRSGPVRPVREAPLGP